MLENWTRDWHPSPGWWPGSCSAWFWWSWSSPGTRLPSIWSENIVKLWRWLFSSGARPSSSVNYVNRIYNRRKYVRKLLKKLVKNSEIKVILPISGHEDECVDGDIGSADDDGLVEATPQLSEVPGRGKSIVSSCEGNTEYQEQQIRNLRRQKYLKTKQWDDLKMLCDSSTYTKLDILRKLKTI